MQNIMGSRFGAIWSYVSHYKYLIVVVLGVAIVGFLDENSFMRRVQYELQIDALQDEINKYNAQNEATTKLLKGLKNDHKSIEKIAREHYFMKTDDEDVYVLSTDEDPVETNRK